MTNVRRSKSSVEQLQRRNRELSILNSITAALNREVDLSQALNAALGQIAELLELQTVDKSSSQPTKSVKTYLQGTQEATASLF